MNLWFRLLGLVLASFWRPRLASPDAASRLAFRVWPGDLDTSMHMNNGRYWTLMDLGRADLTIRTGLWRAVLRHRWTPVLGAGSIRFRRELKPFRRFHLETRILHWAETTMVMEHRILARGRDGRDILSAIALVRAGIYDRRAKAFVPIARLMEEVGADADSPPQGPAVAAFLAAEDVLKREA